MKKPGHYIVIKTDSNDGDYNESFQPIEPEDVEKFLPLIAAIKDFKPYKGNSASGLEYLHKHNWPQGEYCCRPDLGEKKVQEIYPSIDIKLIDEFSDILPRDSEGNVHTIKSISIVNVSSIEHLL